MQIPFHFEENKPSPMTAPNFCMLLRKHIGNGRIVDVSQPKLERIIHLDIEHLDELGDLCRKKLIIEIMGKHSNIIFCDDKGMIIDSIKHVSAQMSSVREVLPGREYFIPDTMEKHDPLTVDADSFIIINATPIIARTAIIYIIAFTSSLTGNLFSFRIACLGRHNHIALAHLARDKLGERRGVGFVLAKPGFATSFTSAQCCMTFGT